MQQVVSSIPGSVGYISHVHKAYDYLGPFAILWVHTAWHKNLFFLNLPTHPSRGGGTDSKVGGASLKVDINLREARIKARNAELNGKGGFVEFTISFCAVWGIQLLKFAHLLCARSAQIFFMHFNFLAKIAQKMSITLIIPMIYY